MSDMSAPVTPPRSSRVSKSGMSSTTTSARMSLVMSLHCSMISS